MKYNAPYGVSDPEAPYVNGNPSTGTMGSIPPAASIEFPQREIAHFIEDARMTPDNADLRQLAKAVQSGQVIYDDDAGTANQIVITPLPPVLALVKGMVFITKILNANTGPSTLKVNSLAPVPVVHASDFSQLAAGELNPGSLQAFGYDGTNFQRVWVQASGAGGAAPIYLAAPRDFYVDATAGNDANDGTTATVTGGHGPFATIQKAFDQVPKYNLNGYSISIHVANGSYAHANCQHVNGSGTILITGNHANPGAVLINGVNATALGINTGCSVYLDGFKVQASGAAPGETISGLLVGGAGTRVLVDAMEFGACVGSQMIASNGATLVNMNPASPWKISGNAFAFMSIWNRSAFEVNGGGGPAITISVPVVYSNAFINLTQMSFSQLSYGSLSGAANVIGGKRYAVDTNSSILTNGGGANYYPGATAGSADAASGGYYS